MAKTLKLLPLGGLGEIGINCFVLEWEGQRVLIDCGIQFPDASHPGVELFLPDLSYITERMDKLLGVVVTHGHDDHIGAIPYLAREGELDVYCTPFPQGLIEHKLTEHREAKAVTFHTIEPDQAFSLGPFTFTPTSVQHSIIEALGLGIETPVGRLVHSGDFKHDPKPVNGKTIGLERFQQWGDDGVHLLLADSTNAEKSGHSLSEHDIASSFAAIFEAQESRLFIALFASNIRRIGNLLRLAKDQGKKVCLIGRSMHGYTKLAHELDSLEIPENTLILPQSLGDYPDDKVVILVTGSQAEPQSALLRMAYQSHRDIQIKKGDLVYLSSRFIPGNEKAISGMINQLYRLGAEVRYESIHQVHVSGHGFKEELELLHKACRPDFFVPVHGEFRHMAKHAQIARETGCAEDNIFVIEDGQTLFTDGEKLTLGEKLELSPTPIVQGSLMERRPIVFTQRHAMAKAGIVFCVIMRDAKTLGILAQPVVSTYGLLFKRDKDLAEAEKEVTRHVNDFYELNRKDPQVTELLRRTIRRFFRDRNCYKPTVICQIFDV